MSKCKNRSLVSTLTPLASALGLTFAVGAAYGQVASTQAKPAEKDQLESIVITARKIAEPASKAPIAVTAISSEVLKDAGVVGVSDIGNVAPGVIMGRDGFGVNINIRGVTTTDTTSKGLPGVAFNVDGVAISRPVAQGLSFFDIDHVEVLRGPQGTLYGKSTTGGAVNVITAKPEFEDQGSLVGEIGNFNTRRLEAVVNKQVSESVAIRVAANTNDRDGFLKPDDGSPARNDQHDRALRLSALFKLAPETTLLLSGTQAKVSGVGFSTVPGFEKRVGGTYDDQSKVFGNPFGGNINEQYNRFNAELNIGLGPATITYVGSRSTFDTDDFTSTTYDPATNRNQYAWRHYVGHNVETSHELRFANSKPGKLNWVVGLNYSDESVGESDHNLNAPVSNPTVAASTNGIDPVNNTTHDSTGVFGQATWSLTDQMSLLLGARQSTDKTARVGTFAAGPSPSCSNALADCIGGPNNGDQSATVMTYRVGVNYQLTPDQLLYSAAATGYKPGGFNDFDPRTNGTAPYDPEELISYEIGYKGRITKNLQFNSNLYYYDYKKDQISSLANINGSFVIYTRSVPTTLYGWENELVYRASENDMIRGSLSFSHSSYGNFMAGLFQNVDWSGKSLDKTPSTVISVSYDHKWRLQSGATIKGRVGMRYSDGYLVSDFVGAVQYKQDAFTKTDLSLTYTSSDTLFYVQGFVNNIEDKFQMTSVGGNNDFGVTTPRFYGIRVGKMF